MHAGTNELERSVRPARRFCLLAAAAAMACAPGAIAQTAGDVLGPAAVVPLSAEQPPARIFVDPPVAASLAEGLAVIQYRAENLRIVPVFGQAALAVSPRIGHVHVTVDDLTWDWAGVSGDPLIIQYLPPGPHRVLLELVNANHHVLDERAVEFVVPDVGQRSRPATQAVTAAAAEAPAKIIVDPPMPEPLARGVVFMQYRAENLQIVPVFGPAALAVSPRIGHVHVTVDDLPWHWADASGDPLIIQNLPPGPHRVLVELVDANHHALDQRMVELAIPDVGQRSRPTTQAGRR